jgi:hypothetical protein
MALDARRNIEKDNKYGAKRAYEWLRSEDCRLICEYAGIAHRVIREGFKRILIESKL